MHDPPRRRRLRFGLRTLFVVITVVACWLGYEVNWIRQRREVAAETTVFRAYRPRIGKVKNKPAPGLLRLLGEPGYTAVVVRFPYRASLTLTASEHAELQRVQKLFPEAEVTHDFGLPPPPDRPSEKEFNVARRPTSSAR